MRRLGTVLAVVACIALFALIQLTAERPGERWDPVCDHAGFRTNEWGTAALVELLGRLGLQTRSWERPWTELSAEVKQLWVVHPVTAVSDEETAALLGWVRAGGTAVLAPDPRGGVRGLSPGRQTVRWALPAEIGLRSVAGSGTGTSVAPRGGARLTRDVSVVRVPAQWRLEAGAKAAVSTLLGDGSGMAAVLARHGRGKVVALCDADMLSNGLIGQADNAVFAANVAFSAPDGAVWFDEYHHGRVGVGAGDLDTGAARRALWAALAALALYAVGKLWRFGPVVPLPGAPRRSAAEYVRAFASLYRRAGHRGAALLMTLQRLHALIAGRCGVRIPAPARAPDASALQAAAELVTRRLPWIDASTLAAVLVRAHLDAAGAGPQTDAELLALTRDIATIERELMGHDR